MTSSSRWRMVRSLKKVLLCRNHSTAFYRSGPTWEAQFSAMVNIYEADTSRPRVAI